MYFWSHRLRSLKVVTHSYAGLPVATPAECFRRCQSILTAAREDCSGDESPLPPSYTQPVVFRQDSCRCIGVYFTVMSTVFETNSPAVQYKRILKCVKVVCKSNNVTLCELCFNSRLVSFLPLPRSSISKC
jgi:hypothetical protein